MRQFAIVFHRLERFGVTVQTNMTDTGGGNELQNAVHHAQTCTKNRNKCQLLAGNHIKLSSSDRGLNRYRLQGEIPCRFIAKKHGNFADKTAKLRRGRFLVAHKCKLVLNERMVGNGYG